MMRERRIGVGELKADLNRFLAEVRAGTTLLVTDGDERVARVIPEPDVTQEVRAAAKDAGIVWSGRRLKKRMPSVRLRGEGSIADIVRANRG